MSKIAPITTNANPRVRSVFLSATRNDETHIHSAYGIRIAFSRGRSCFQVAESEIAPCPQEDRAGGIARTKLVGN